jgi:hypothetical protein
MSTNWFLRFFEKNGIIKILVAFVILVISILFIRSYPHSTFFKITGYIGLGYLVLSVAIFIGAGLINTIKDIFKERK